MKSLVVALLYILLSTTLAQITLPLQEQLAVDALRRAIPTLPSLWGTYSDVSFSSCATSFQGLACTGNTITSIDFNAVAGMRYGGGTIPPEIGLLSNVTSINMADLSLTGTLPSALFGLTKLVSVHLENNKLTGSIPDVLYTQSLQTLNLRNNSFNGSIPTVSATTVATFNVQVNNLRGTVPLWLGSSSFGALLGVNIGGADSVPAGNIYTGCVPKLGSNSACTYFADSNTNCFCPGQCVYSPCKCSSTNTTIASASCTQKSPLFSGTAVGQAVDIVQIGEFFYFRCSSSLCSYHVNSSNIANLNVDQPHAVVASGSNVYYTYANSGSPSVGYYNGATTSDLSVPISSLANARLQTVGTSVYVLDGANLTKIDGAVVTTPAVTTTLSSGSSVVQTTTGIRVHLEDTSPYNGAAAICGAFSGSTLHNLLAGANDDIYFIVSNATVNSLYRASPVSTGATCTELYSGVLNSQPFLFSSSIYFFTSATPPVLTSCSSTSCATTATYGSFANSVDPLFFSAQSRLFVTTGESEVRYINGASTSVLVSTGLSGSTFKDAAVVDSKLFYIYNSNIYSYSIPEGNRLIGDVDPSSNIFLGNFFATSPYLVYFDSATNVLVKYDGMFNGCKFPNLCSFNSKSSCTPDVILSVTCGATNVTCNSTTSVLVASTCAKKDACAVNNGNCALGKSCADNGDGTVTCSDIDQCALNTHNCVNRSCINIDGLYTCNTTCPPGYITNGTYRCADADECVTSPCSGNATCTNSVGNFSCACNTNYSGNPYQKPSGCYLTDPCGQLRPCYSNSFCTNTGNGNYNCTCNNGYQFNGTGCADINECGNSTLNNCNASANCLNNAGGYTCACKPGFAGNGVSNCTNIDECANATANGVSICGTNATCADTFGNYTCTCITNYSGNPYVSCYPGDPCGTLKPCHVNASCAIVGGGNYTCTCLPGFTGTGITCTDILECSNSSLNNCTANSTCQEMLGSYDCPCNAGFAGNGKTDICYSANPCGSGPCDGNATCTNGTRGAFTCACKTGYVGNAYNRGGCVPTCNNSSPCSPDANCADANGTIVCTCKSGFSGNGYNCTDNDECVNATACAANTTCSNSPPGSFTCACIANYNGNATSGSQGCSPIDGCQLYGTIALCGTNSNCTSTGPNTTTCACVTGFVLRSTPPSCFCDYNTNQATCASSSAPTFISQSVASGTTPVTFNGPVVLGNGVMFNVTGDTVFAAGITVPSTASIDATRGSLTLQGTSSIDGTIYASSSGSITIPCTTTFGNSANMRYNVQAPIPQNNTQLTLINTACTSPVSYPSVTFVTEGCQTDYVVTGGSSSNGRTVTYNNPCAISNPGTGGDSSIPFWVWIIVGVGGALILAVILLFAIPSSRRAILGDSDDEDEEMAVRGKSGSQSGAKPGSARGTGSTSERKAIPNPPFNVTAIADYMAVDTSQISVTKGVVYTVQRVDEGQHWFQAKGANGKLGWFPASYSKIES